MTYVYMGHHMSSWVVQKWLQTYYKHLSTLPPLHQFSDTSKLPMAQSSAGAIIAKPEPCFGSPEIDKVENDGKCLKMEGR